MDECVLKTNNLTKTYRGVKALDNVSITMTTGKIYGLIGQNGAGKTTFMRVVSGLTFPDKGTFELFGHTGDKSLQLERKRIGCMIEYPGLVPNMTAKEFLRYRRLSRGIPDKELEVELLKRIGLAETGKKKIKHFSLGMKQRLGIANALLGNPEFLMLDEPINGLDPIGIVEIRSLIKKLCEELNITILISSHNLPELYQTATDYIIIHQGKIKQEITLEALEGQCKHHIHIGCNEPEKLVSILEMKLHTKNYQVMPDKSVKLYDYLNKKEWVAQVIYENGIIATDLSVRGDTLEDYFVSVIGGGKDV